jgi:hypothetical protein
VTTEGVETAVKKLRIGKAAGLGNIPAEFLKTTPQKLYEMIAQLFTICINEHTIPKKWNITHITPIYKHGDRKKCDNYRAISITSTFSRLFERIIRDLIETKYKDKEAKEQAGFRAGRTCNDNAFVLKQLIEKQLSIGKEVHLLFIDQEKAYDNIPLTFSLRTHTLGRGHLSARGTEFFRDVPLNRCACLTIIVYIL